MLLLASSVFAKDPPGRAATTVIFVNCAETRPGDDDALSIAGQEQAGQLASFLKDTEISAVYAPFKQCLIKTVEPLATSKQHRVQYFRDASSENLPEIMEHILKTMMEQNAGKTIVVCAPSKSILKMANMLGIREKDLKSSRGAFEEVLIVNVLDFGEAVAQKLNMNFQKKV